MADGGLVVFDHKHGVAPGLQGAERGNKAFVVAGVQANGGLVEHVGHAHEPCAKLGCQADALGLATGKRCHGPAQGEVVKADTLEEREPVQELLQQCVRNDRPAPRKGARLEPVDFLVDGQGAEVGNAEPVYLDGQGFRGKALAMAGRTIHGLAVAVQLVAPGLAILHALFEQRHDAGPALFRDLEIDLRLKARPEMRRLVVALGEDGNASAHPVATQACRSGGRTPRFVLAIEEGLPSIFRVILERRCQREAVALAKGSQRLFVGCHGLGRAPGKQGALGEGESPVGGNEPRLEIVYCA